jgi:hypothetical protein
MPMLRRNLAGPVLALGGTLVWGILETIALQRARRKAAARFSVAHPTAPTQPAETSPNRKHDAQ